MPADAEILATGQPAKKEASTPWPQDVKPVTATSKPTHTPTPTLPPTTFESIPTETPVPIKAASPIRVEVVTWWLNVRSGPGLDYPVVATLAQGETLPVLKTDPDSGWLQVQLSGSDQLGWVSDNPAYVLVTK